MTALASILKDGEDIDMPAFRAWLATVSAQAGETALVVSIAELGALVGDRVYDTRAQLPSAPAAGLYALVTLDPDDALIGLWKKTGAAGSPGWDGPSQVLRGPGLDAGQLAAIAAAEGVVGDVETLSAGLDSFRAAADGAIAARATGRSWVPITVSAVPSPSGGYYTPAQGHRMFGFGVNCDIDYQPDQFQIVLNGLAGDYGAPNRVASILLRVVTRALSAGDPSPEPGNFSLPTQLVGDVTLIDRHYSLAEIMRQPGSAQSEIPVAFDLSDITVIRSSQIAFFVFSAYDAGGVLIGLGVRNAISVEQRTGENDWLFGFYSDTLDDLTIGAPLPVEGVISYRLTARSYAA